MKRVAVALAVVALLAPACTEGRRPAPAARPPSVTVLVQNVTLLAGERATRIGFRPADPTARVIVTFADLGTASIVAVCGLGDIEETIPQRLTGPECRSEIPSGVREEIARAEGLGAVALWVRSGGAVTASIKVEYAETSRALSFRVPLLRAEARNSPRCNDNACALLVETEPVRRGPFTASARWDGGAARLALLQGRILAKSFTATGVPYAVAAEREARAPVSIEARMSAPAEYALVLDRNSGNLTAIVIDARWP